MEFQRRAGFHGAFTLESIPNAQALGYAGLIAQLEQVERVWNALTERRMEKG